MEFEGFQESEINEKMWTAQAFDRVGPQNFKMHFLSTQVCQMSISIPKMDPEWSN